MAQILGTGYQRAAKASQVLVGGINGTSLAFASWKADMKAADLPTLNFESYSEADDESYGEGIHGALECDANFGGDWDAHLNPMAGVPGLYPRDDVQNLVFNTNRSDALYWLFPYFRIRAASSGAEVAQKVTFTASGHNQGQFDWPTGSV